METRRIVKQGVGLPVLLAVAAVLTAPSAVAGPLGRVGHSIFQGTIHERTQLGAVTTLGRLLVIGSDEGTAIQVLLPGDEIRFEAEEIVDWVNGLPHVPSGKVATPTL